MTAEIVLMNRNAVAMAADSAGTIDTQYGSKTSPSMNKLFALSYEHPIGIMIYNSSYFMGLPWETIIYSLREEVKGKEFDYLEDFEKFFINFLQKNLMFDRSRQMELGMIELEYYHRNLLGKMEYDLEKYFENISASDPDISFERSEYINSIRKYLTDYIKEISESDKYYNNFNDVIQNFTQEIENIGFVVYETIYDEIKDLIQTINELFFNKMIRVYASGIVISGFGKLDYIPKTCSMEVDRVLENKLAALCYDIKDCTIAPQILAFAQRDTVDSFITGINPLFENYIEDILKAKCPDLAEEVKKDMDSYSQSICVTPIYRAVSSMPKTELAMMAETLINLSSFKLKITNEIETIGGPIDVAIITKSDGFVWVKRKFYFDSDLNPHYIAKYYK